MTDQITITNPVMPHITWTSGNRGKPPLWVTMSAEYIAFKAQKALVVTEGKVVEVGPVTDTRLKFWKWIGIEDMKAMEKCYVAAHSRSEALKELNRTFKSHPVSGDELNRMWALVEPSGDMPQGVGAYHFKEGVWTKR